MIACSNIVVSQENFNDNQFEDFHYEQARPDSIRSSYEYDQDGSGQSLEVNLHRDDPDVNGSRRAELRLDHDAGKFMIGDEAWVRFSLLVPDSYEIDNSFEIFFQMHSYPDSHLGEDWRSPPIDLRIDNGEFFISHQYDRNPLTRNNTPEEKFRYSLGNIEAGIWTNFYLQVNYQLDETGSIRLYRDGQLAYRYEGIVGYNDVGGMFTKIGIYKPDWKYSPEKSSTFERTLYFDAFQFGVVMP